MTGTMTFDKATRQAICEAVSREIAKQMEDYTERWLTAEEVCKTFGMISPDWLKRYGHKLPRERMEVTDSKTGKMTASRWGYPLHRLQRFFAEHENKTITI